MAVKKKAVKAKTAARNKTTVKKTVKKAAKKTVKKAAKKVAKKAVAKQATAKKVATKNPATTKKTATPKKGTTRSSAAPARQAGSRKPAAQVGPVPGIAPYVEKKGEEYMNDRQVTHFRNILMAWKRSLMEEVDRTVHHMQDDAANFPDPNDRATQESEFSMELRARDRERKLIKKIEESIRHLDSNDFGYCEACGVEIGVRRLEARPTATLCIDCKILDEIREKQMG
jgi:DnaK suppressor protein